MNIDVLVSVACMKDAETWSVASRKIIENIHAEKYVIIVPPEDIDYFLSISPPNFEVISEDSILDNVKAKIHDRLKDSPSSQRVGWYLQQFLKIAAVNYFPGENFVIWDADSVPIKKIQFFDISNRPIYHFGSEYHEPYFMVINKLLGIRRELSLSFIAQSFAIKKCWLNEFINEVECRSKLYWVEAILAVIDPNNPSSFSEYETLGTFFSFRHGSEIRFSSARWLRYGRSLLGAPENLDCETLRSYSRIYSFICFEKSDVKSYKFSSKIWIFFQKNILLSWLFKIYDKFFLFLILIKNRLGINQ